MIHRTYLVTMPPGGEAPGPIALDIVPQTYPGTASDPVDSGNSPVGWNGTGGQYFEITGRPMRFETVDGDDGFVPLLNLGVTVSVVPYGSTDSVLPGVQLSDSFQAWGVSLTDPSYGPVIRLAGDSADVGNGVFLVSIQIMQAKDQDRTAAGT